MRHVICALPLLLCLVSPVQGGPRVTLLFQFEDRHSDESVAVMKEEVRSLMTGVDVDWRLIDDLRTGESFADLVVVKFRGSCQMQTIPPYLIDERGPTALAFTHTADGEVLPFSEVECDKVRVAIRSAMHGDDFRHADALLGRALGRVLAHELYHVIENTQHHERRGVNRSALSGAQLISDRRP